ncbi:DUF6338 family protein [Pseudarthrobacter sp. J64]|uniref:DUF6338 family protein n=1 Tax=Pseudarthrobacter sp. J64 TaxID=3116485 RepID=UPI002E80255A|nr:DUF6338 family protein [Pseudarthrobacter sp. J64]MEE2569566.1 DUF6338 family protein [Pseudarthrobacter sp. J64]
MPTEPIAAIVYICLLLPGIAFIWNFEGHRPSIKRSVFRETATVVIASAASLLSVFVCIYVAAFFVDSVQRGLLQFFVDPAVLLKDDSQQFLGVLLGGVVASVLVGAFYGSATAHRWFRLAVQSIYALFRKDVPSLERGLSAWTAAFEALPGHDVRIGAQLKSGTWIQGNLYTFNQDGHDGPDRALTLSGDILYRLAESAEVRELEGFSMVVLHSSEIEFMTVGHELAPRNRAA